MASKKRKRQKVRGLRERYGRWEYRFRLNGKDHSVLTVYEATEARIPDVLLLIREHKQQARQALQARRHVTFSSAVDEFLTWSEGEHREHQATAKRHRTSMASLGAFFGTRRLAEITAGDVDNFKTWRRSKGIQEVTIRHDLHAASQLFQFAARQRWVSGNPIREVVMPSDRASRNEKVLAPEEEARYLMAAGSHKVLHDVARLMLLQGLRPEEVLGIEVSHVDLDRRLLTVPRGKSAAARRVLDLTDESLRILGRRIGHSDRYIFTGGRWPGSRAPFTYSGLVNAHNRALEASATCFNIYSLRHTFATRLYQHTKDIVSTARILGHGDLKTVLRYVHVDRQQVKEAMRKFEEAQRGPTLQSKTAVQHGPKLPS